MPLDVPAVIVNDAVFVVEVAATAVQIGRGLSGREVLEPGTGMLFVFAPRVARSFWMYDMRFPLDMVWISDDCIVVDITPNVPAPAPGTPASELPVYSSSSAAGYTLEINAGEAERYGIKPGAPVRFGNVNAAAGPACP